MLANCRYLLCGQAEDRRRRGRLEVAVRDRDEELRELRRTMECNERALLSSLDDERRRWSAERLLMQVGARHYVFGDMSP